MNTRIKRLTVLAFAVFAFLCVRDAAYADSAPYLKYAPAYVVSDTDMGERLVKTAAKSSKGMTQTGEVKENSPFLAAVADAADLIDCGTFTGDEVAYRQIWHLVRENGFRSFALSDCRQFGGNAYSVKTGDAVFFLNENRRPVGSGIVTGLENGKMSVAAGYTDGYGTLSIDLNDAESYNNKLRVVEVRYPYAETVIYAFLRGEMGYANEAACGILTNICQESYFHSDKAEGEGGRGFGICQWTGYRRQNLLNFCSEKGYDYRHLMPQLKFMQYELSTEFKPVDTMLRSVSQTDEGSYDAAHAFCYYYELPDDYIDVAEARGQLCEDTFYPAYREVA